MRHTKFTFIVWQRITMLLLIIFSASSVVTFHHARGTSYFFDDPLTCKNCHIMREQFDGWNRSTHKSVTTCYSCHSPQDVIGQYIAKGRNGVYHSFAFTTGYFAEPIQITSFNSNIVKKNCLRCHENAVQMMGLTSPIEAINCITCHGNVGHNNRY